ncbi:MAG: hypothetical protein PF630_03960 [Gammaproteobacteria bacterium]|jgi:hypothetical protein|nr:hypothetical protein [Gammaproteobacteria bacterium]
MLENIDLSLQSFLIAMLWISAAGGFTVVVLALLQMLTLRGDPRHSSAAISRRLYLKRMLREVEQRKAQPNRFHNRPLFNPENDQHV